MSYHNILPMLLFLFAISVHTTASSHTTSKVTNNTSKSFYVYWTAAGCAGVTNIIRGSRVPELCKKVKMDPHSYATYRFSGSKTNIQVKVQPECIDNTESGHSPRHTDYCPSGSWIHVNGGACKLTGKGRGHVKNVVINDFKGVSKSGLHGHCYK